MISHVILYIERGDYMALTNTSEYTVEDIYNLPDGQRAELIDGNIYMMAPPSRKHQDISMALSHKIKDYILSNKGTCAVYAAPFAVFLNEDDRTYVEPDLSVICDRDKLTDAGCNGAPDWVIEIVSSSSRQMDYMRKLFKYRSAGVREYWIVDYNKDRITIYNFETGTTEEYQMKDTVPVGIFNEFKIDFAEIME